MFRSGHNCLAWSDLDLHWEFPEGDLERDGCRWDQFTSCHHYRHRPHHCNHHHSSCPSKCKWDHLTSCHHYHHHQYHFRQCNHNHARQHTGRTNSLHIIIFVTTNSFVVVIVVIIVVILLNLTSKGWMQAHFLINVIVILENQGV